MTYLPEVVTTLKLLRIHGLREEETVAAAADSLFGRPTTGPVQYLKSPVLCFGGPPAAPASVLYILRNPVILSFCFRSHRPIWMSPGGRELINRICRMYRMTALPRLASN
jgi:hypothetical protein